MKIQYLLIAVILTSCSQITKEKADTNPKDTSILISGIASKIEVTTPELKTEAIKNSTDFIRRVIYKGTLNETIKISLYLNEQEHPCGGNSTILNAMYKYDNQEKWILLSVSTDQQKKNYCMVEDNFSGVLFLEENAISFNGNWISPDTNKQYKVELENVILKFGSEFDKSIIEKLDEILFDDLIFNKNDC